MKKTISIFFIAHCSLLIVQAQQITHQWVARYNELPNGNNRSNCIASDLSGNVYVSGGSPGNGSGNDIVTIKYNPGGTQQWIARYNGPGNGDDQASGLCVDVSGNIYVSGKSHGTGPYNDFVTLKYSTGGQLQWEQRYNGPDNYDDVVEAMAIDSSGNVYVTGYSVWLNGNSDFVTIKYNSSGVQQWLQRYEGPAGTYDNPYAVTSDNAGNVYVTGLSRGLGTHRDYATIKYNSLGLPQWVARYDGPSHGYDMSYAIGVDTGGSVFVTGTSWNFSSGYDYATVKYSAAGVELWVRRYDGGGYGGDEARDLKIDSDGSVCVTGEIWSSNFDRDFGTIKYNSNGTIRWMAFYDGPGNNNDEANALVIDSENNIYVTGWSRSGSAFGTEDFFTIKYAGDGAVKWSARYNGPANNEDKSNAIAIDQSGNVFITGGSYNGSGFDYATLKYIQPIGIEPISTEIPEHFKLYQNYPNPFNAGTTIRFDLPSSPLRERGEGGFVSLKLYDALGREVATLLNESLAPGSYQVSWHAENFPSGIYFCRLTSGNFSPQEVLSEGIYDWTETRKMLLLK